MEVDNCKCCNPLVGYDQGICPTCGDIFCGSCTKTDMRKCPNCKVSLLQSPKKVFKDLCKLRENFLKIKKTRSLTDRETFGSVATLNCLSERYINGIGTGKDAQKAEQMCREVIELGNPTGPYNLYHLLKHKDPEQANIFLHQASEMGFNKAQLILSMEMRVLNRGLHTEESAKLLKQSALSGLVEAQYQLGLAFHLIEIPGEDSVLSEKKALFWYERASKQDHGGSLNNAGLFYKEGCGCIGNIAKAISYFERSIVVGCKEAGYGLGCIYEDAKDYKKAGHYYTIASGRGCPPAMFRLGLMIITEKISPIENNRSKCLKQGLDMVKESAKYDHQEAIDYLSTLREQVDQIAIDKPELDGNLIRDLLY